MNDISVLIPAYNEEDRIQLTIQGLKKSKFINNIVVIDDGSKDNTYKTAKDSGVEIIRIRKNIGKGYALKLGIDRVIDKSKIIVFIDADLGNSANEVDKLIIPILNDECDVTIAKFKAPIKKGGIGLVKMLSKKGVKYFTGIQTNCSLSGQRGYKRDVLKSINYIPLTFGIEVSMLIDILKLGYRIKEINVEMNHRETVNNIKGILHRGKQFSQIFYTLLRKGMR